MTSPAASYDLTDISTVKAELGLAINTKDALLAAYITQASGGIADYCRRVFASEGVTERFWYEDRFRDRHPGNWCRRQATSEFIVQRRPVTEVTSITLDGGSALDESLYQVDEDRGLILALDASGSPSCFHFGKEAVVVYTAGYDLGAQSPPEKPQLPPGIERACIEWVKELYFGSSRDPALQSEQAYRVATFTYFDRSKGMTALPPAVVSLLGPHRSNAAAIA